MRWLPSWQELSGCSSDSLSINYQVVFSTFSQLLCVVDVYRRTISQMSRLQVRGDFPGITELLLTDVTVWRQCLCPPLQEHFILSAALGWDGWVPVGVLALATNPLARISRFSSTYRWQNWASPDQTNEWYLWCSVREFLPEHLSCGWAWTYLEETPMRYNFFWILPLFISLPSTEKQVRYNIKWLYRK